jgi:hypothetical protein
MEGAMTTSEMRAGDKLARGKALLVILGTIGAIAVLITLFW